MVSINLMQGDCLELLEELYGTDGCCVGMVMVDLPYGTTACKWDTIIDLDRMWRALSFLCEQDAAMVFTAGQPFTSKLIMSKPDWFKYCWIWNKARPTGFANAKKQPLRDYEDVVVFGRGKVKYNPQGLVYLGKEVRNSNSCGGDSVRGDTEASKGKGSLRTGGKSYVQEWTNYPRQVQKFNSEGKTVHPTQKPLALMEYLIKTYTDEGDTVLDFTMGSGTTGVAAKNLGRSFIGIELDPAYFQIAKERIESV